MIIDNSGKLFDERRKAERRIQNIKVKNDKRISERRNSSNIQKKDEGIL